MSSDVYLLQRFLPLHVSGEGSRQGLTCLVRKSLPNPHQSGLSLLETFNEGRVLEMPGLVVVVGLTLEGGDKDGTLFPRGELSRNRTRLGRPGSISVFFKGSGLRNETVS